jgi:hypothetical protein
MDLENGAGVQQRPPLGVSEFLFGQAPVTQKGVVLEGRDREHLYTTRGETLFYRGRGRFGTPILIFIRIDAKCV